MKVLGSIGKVVGLLAIMGLVVLLVGMLTDVWVETNWPGIACADLPWEVVVKNYRDYKISIRISGNCLLAGIKTTEQAEEAIVLARKYNDEKTETSASGWWDETILKTLDEVQTCDQAMNAWRASSPNLKEKSHMKVLTFCEIPAAPVVEKGGRK